MVQCSSVEFLHEGGMKTMNNELKKGNYIKLTTTLAIFFILILPFSLFAQNAPQKGVEILEENEGVNTSSGKSYWDEHFSASIGTSYAYSFDGRSYRAYSYTGLSWKDDFDWIVFNLEGLLARRDYQYVLTLDPKDTKSLDLEIQATQSELNDTAFPPDATRRIVLNDRLTNLEKSRKDRQAKQRFNLGIRDDQILLREANVKFKFGDSVQLLVGWHTVVWGQLDVLSPVDFILPLRIGSTGLGITKADNRNPQLMSVLYIFPQPWIEMQAYIFPNLGIDDAFLNNIQTRVSNANNDYRTVKDLELPSGKDAYRYAGRTLFYLDNLTIGFTYYQGFLQFDPNENLELASSTKNGKTIYELSGESELQLLQAYAFEIAVPQGKWVWKLDASYLKSNEDLKLDVQTYNNQILGYIAKDELFDKRTAYVNWILEKNNGKLEVKDGSLIATAGVDANLDKWLFNLGLLMFINPRTAKEKEGFKLYRKAEEQQGNPFGDGEFFAAPIINISRYLDKGKRDVLGFSAGFLNTGFGLVLYGSQEYFDSLRVALSFEYLFLFSNGLVNVEGYELESLAFPAIRFTLDYRL